MEATVTEHADLRMRKRMGLPRRAVDRMASTALEKGRRHSDYAGSFRRYLDGVYLHHRNANNMRVYAGQLFLFDEDRLITCWPIPNQYRKARPAA